MISDEIRNGIEANCDIQELKNNSRNKERKEYQIKREPPTPYEAYELNEHLNNIRYPKPWRCESRVVRSDLVSVCKEKGSRAY